jgi:PhzF family phenazine biosynthesis protein
MISSTTEETGHMVSNPPEAQPAEQQPPTVLYRNVCPTDLPAIYALEKASYPSDEAASRSQLQYRQHHAASFFRCAIKIDSVSDGKAEDEEMTVEKNVDSLRGMGEIIGYVTATRCHQFTEESMKVHHPNGSLLAIHSVVVDENYRRQGTGLAMLKEYIETLRKMDVIHGIKKVVLLSKMEKVPFYIQAGFRVMGESKIVHGDDKWYDCELDLDVRGIAEKNSQYWVIDSFAKAGTSGSGNPAAVVMIPNSKPGRLPSLSVNSLEAYATEDHSACMFDPDNEENVQWMKSVACEFNLSETAFIWNCSTKDGKDPTLDDTSQYNIRFYTCDGTEVDLCGHATLAATSVILEHLSKEGIIDQVVVFKTKKDVLKAKAARTSMQLSATTRKIVMDFPKKNLVILEQGTNEYDEVISMLHNSLFQDNSIEELETNIVCRIGIDIGGDDLLVEINPESFALLPTKIQDNRIAPLVDCKAYKRGVIVCCNVPEKAKVEGERADFYSRFFGPKVGISEDPVTGSAHCVLGPYYANKLQKDVVIGNQMSHRGGIVECEVIEDLVRIKGIAVIAMNGALYI